jgi:hypothetical protein
LLSVNVPLPSSVGVALPWRAVPGFPAAGAADHLHHHAIESLNYQLRKITKNHAHFPNDQAAVIISGWSSETSKTNAPGKGPD